jgi:hypothetical protein
LKRTFLKTTITAGGTPQPVFGTKSTGAIVASATAQSVPVTSSAHFAVGDQAIIDSGANYEVVQVTALADSTHVTAIFTKAHAANVFISLYLPCNTVYIQATDGNTGTLFIGNSSALVKATFVGVICQLIKVASGVQPAEFSDSMTVGSDPFNTSEYWIDGTTGDGYLPSIGVA